MTGARFAVPSTPRSWRLRPVLIRHLHHLHSAGIAAIERRSNAFIGGETAHGLEQQLIESLIDCLSQGLAIEAAPATRTHQDVVIRFEAFLQAHLDRALHMVEICSALGVSARDLRLACEEQLGIGPAEYARRRRTQHLDRAPTRWNAKGSCKH
jgi:transcriptional regulator GlxA family with amidase domain